MTFSTAALTIKMKFGATLVAVDGTCLVPAGRDGASRERAASEFPIVLESSFV